MNFWRPDISDLDGSCTFGSRTSSAALREALARAFWALDGRDADEVREEELCEDELCETVPLPPWLGAELAEELLPEEA
jgi:hypothetical protein